MHDRKLVQKLRSGARFAGTPHAERITQLYGDTATFDFSEWYGAVDFVFVDTGHSAPYVRNDTEVALRLVGNRAGVIAWHDYHEAMPGVANTLREYCRSHPRLGGRLWHIRGTSIAICSL